MGCCFPLNHYKSKDNQSAWCWKYGKPEWFLATGIYVDLLFIRRVKETTKRVIDLYVYMFADVWRTAYNFASCSCSRNLLPSPLSGTWARLVGHSGCILWLSYWDATVLLCQFSCMAPSFRMHDPELGRWQLQGKCIHTQIVASIPCCCNRWTRSSF